MKVVIAIDSLKGSLTSLQAGEAIKGGGKEANPDAEVLVRPLADGGEGTVEALALGLGGSLEKISVTGPVGKTITAEYGIIKDTKTAIIEMSAAAGITKVHGAELNPLNTTTFGVGEMICDAMEKGCRDFIIGIGGSATNDGGLGMLSALDFKFFDKDGQRIGVYGRDLEKIARISKESVNPMLAECKFSIACDVTNPLCGEMGCSSVYGPQKGATPEIVKEMDSWLFEYAKTAAKVFPNTDPDFPGSGAAGGLGFAFRTFLSGELLGGIDLVLSKTDLESYIKDADIVVTGEGRLDFQTAMGKAPIGVARLAKKYNKPVVAFAGCVTKEAVECNKSGIDAFFPILREVVDLDTAMNAEYAAENMTATARQVFRAINIKL